MGDSELGAAAFDTENEKRIEVMLRENDYGPFLKISEGKPKVHQWDKVIIPASGIAALFAEITTCVGYGAELSEGGGDPNVRGNAVHSKSLKVEAKVVFVDLLENSRGRYLKLSTRAPHSQGKSTVVIPAAACPELLASIRSACGVPDGADPETALAAKFPAPESHGAAVAASASMDSTHSSQNGGAPAPREPKSTPQAGAKTAGAGGLPKSRVLKDGGRRIVLEPRETEAGVVLAIRSEGGGHAAGEVTLPLKLWRLLGSRVTEFADAVHPPPAAAGAAAAAPTTRTPATGVETGQAAAGHGQQQQQQHQPPAGKARGALWVENLPWTYTTEDLVTEFGAHGTLDVDATHCNVRRNNKPSGTAKVRYLQPKDAEKALEAMQGKELGEPPRAIRVRWDHSA